MDELRRAGKYVNTIFSSVFISVLVAFTADLLTHSGYKDSRV